MRRSILISQSQFRKIIERYESFKTQSDSKSNTSEKKKIHENKLSNTIINILEKRKKTLIQEQKTPKNATYVTGSDRKLTSLNGIFGGSFVLRQGTKFTAHQTGDKNLTSPTYTASVDKVENGKSKASTVFYCNGENAGKFWNASNKSWYYDTTRILSGYLAKNLCFKSDGDQSYWEKRKTDIKYKSSPNQIAAFLKASDTWDDDEPAIEKAFSEIRTWERYNMVKKILGQDPYQFVSKFIDANEKHGKIQSVTTSYKLLQGGPTSDQNKSLKIEDGCPVVLTADKPGGPKQYMGSPTYMNFFKDFGTPGADPLLISASSAKVPKDFGWNLNPKTYPYPQYYSQKCIDISAIVKGKDDRKKANQRDIEKQKTKDTWMQTRDTETTDVKTVLPNREFKKPSFSLNESVNAPEDYQKMLDFNQSLSKQKELIPKYCTTPLKNEYNPGTIESGVRGSESQQKGGQKSRQISMYTLCKNYGGLWVFGAGTSKYTCGCRDNSNPALNFNIKTDIGDFNMGSQIRSQQGSTNWANADARQVIFGVAALAAAFIPVVGPFVAAGIGLGGAADLWTSNQKKEAAITAFFSMLPLIGEIPAIGKIGEQLAENLRLAILENKSLSPKEMEILIKIINYDTQISSKVLGKLESKALGKIEKKVLETAIEETEEKVFEAIGAPTYGQLKSTIKNAAANKFSSLVGT